MSIEKNYDELINKYKQSDVWLELYYDDLQYFKDEFIPVKEELICQKRIVKIDHERHVIIHSKDLTSFLKEMKYKPTDIQTLVEANLSDDFFSIDSVSDILLSEEFASEVMDIDSKEIDKICEDILDRCKIKINKLSVEEVKNFDLSYVDVMLAEEARIALLPFYVAYRDKLLMEAKEIEEKIISIQQTIRV